MTSRAWADGVHDGVALEADTVTAMPTVPLIAAIAKILAMLRTPGRIRAGVLGVRP